MYSYIFKFIEATDRANNNINEFSGNVKVMTDNTREMVSTGLMTVFKFLLNFSKRNENFENMKTTKLRALENYLQFEYSFNFLSF